MAVRSPSAAARAELGDAWDLPTGVISGPVGRDGNAILEAAAAGRIGALVVAGVDPSDLADPRTGRPGTGHCDFLV